MVPDCLILLIVVIQEEDAGDDADEESDAEDDDNDDEEEEEGSGLTALVTGSDEKFSDVIEMAAKFQPTGNTLVSCIKIKTEIKYNNQTTPVFKWFKQSNFLMSTTVQKVLNLKLNVIQWRSEI